MNPLAEIFTPTELAHSNLSCPAPLFLDLLGVERAKQHPQIIVAKSLESYFVHQKNLKFWCQLKKIPFLCFPPEDISLFNKTALDPWVAIEQISCLFELSAGNQLPILLVTAQSLLSRYPAKEYLLKHAKIISTGDKVQRDEFIINLLRLGFSKVTQVLDKGTFAVRGSIIDIFLPKDLLPTRIDFFGDIIDSIKFFDFSNQRNTNTRDIIFIGPIKPIIFDAKNKIRAKNILRELADELNFPTTKLNLILLDIENNIYSYGSEKLIPAFYDKRETLLELINNTYDQDKPHIILDDQQEIYAQLEKYETQQQELYAQALFKSDLVFPPAKYFNNTDFIKNYFANFNITSVDNINYNNNLQIKATSTHDIRADILKQTLISKNDPNTHLLEPLAKKIKKLFANKYAVVICVSSLEYARELQELLRPLGIHSQKIKSLGNIYGPDIFIPHVQAHILKVTHAPTCGAIFDDLKLALIGEDDIFGKRTKKTSQQGKQKGFKTNLGDLEVDNYIIHVDHGIGKFAGLVRLNLRGIENDFVLIFYANQEKLYLPTHKINLIKNINSAPGQERRLDKLGGTSWVSKKNKVKQAVLSMAQDLLKLYAQREIASRTPCDSPDAHYLEFESLFEFEPTPDQERACKEVITDMQKPTPMDRLICGDVGYGKTEVAMRAAMFALLNNRQVAILAPTTVLVQQHVLTFQERFKKIGAQIGVLSRFQKPQQIKNTLKLLEQGKLDIIIGTHRLLSPDIKFANLGLVIIDEEQRFGIKSKEHLKKLKTQIDILSMSATPIPRTMQMGFFGLRDLSIIETPPVDRRAIQTSIIQFDDDLIREAILRELGRSGQIYFVHNRVRTIETTAQYLQKLIPEARIGVAHGQMNERELETQMLKFMNHEINLLVCTTIIETGIDVSTANTMFVDHAEDFGLSQLYQLRGRIGRSKERAFAYLVTQSARENLSEIARARLNILHQFSDLGAGFKIAQHDLELRGAGDLLGKNQHGHMAAVGYDLYAELLQEAVASIRGSQQNNIIDPEVSLPVSALIPEKFCPDLHERMSLYQQLATVENKENLQEIFSQLEDTHGILPEEVLALRVLNLLKLELKLIHALNMSIRKNTNNFDIIIGLSKNSPVNQDKILFNIKNNKNIKITPQQKIILSLGNSETNLREGILKIGLEAIEKVKNLLF